MRRLSLFFLFQLALNYTLSAQVELELIQPAVTRENNTLELAFAGGINSAQYQSIDLDGDGDLDLVVFDRSSDKVNCFENTEAQYVYQPDFEFLFPENIQHWMVLADYNCDGKKDLFTYTGQGIRVFRNSSSSGTVSWELEVEPLKTFGSSSLINLLFNPTDIPSIADLDNDGDLDILVFDFAGSSQIEFHQNHSIENTGSCGLDFVRETRSYGDIMDCLCDNFTVNEPCSSSGKILHAGGKALLSLDYDMDGLMDLVLSQEACENLSFSPNIGTLTQAVFEPFDNAFPLFSEPINFNSFPAASYEDVTFDGKKDLIVSSNQRSNATLTINFKSSSFLYENTGINTSQFEASVPFLQNQMIDVGEYAYPAIADIDGDGNTDLIIGNAGSIVTGSYIGSLSYYQSIEGRLEWQTDDLFGLTTLGFTEIKPQFIDINDDQRIDLVFSALDATNVIRLFYILSQDEALANLNLSQLQFIDVALRRLDDYTLDFVDDDELPDLLIGLSNGRLDYYTNTGSKSNPMFTLQTESYLDIVPDNDKSNLSLAVGDVDGDGESDLVTTDRRGKLVIYSNYKSTSTVAQESLIKTQGSNVLLSSRLGRITKPTMGQLLGREVIAIGSIQGGLRLLATASASEGGELVVKAFPIPTLEHRIVNFQSNLSGTQLEIFSLAGHKITAIELTAYQNTPVNLSYLKAGLYLAKATRGNQSCTIKIIVNPFN